MDFLAGETLYIDKPLKWTSFDVVNKIRLMFKNILGIKKIKVGHAGTLDPLATGLVIVCTGKSTKSLESMMNHDKEYRATIRLGQTTPSFDLETEVDENYPTEHITRELIDETIRKHFLGDIEQVPPVYSAIRIDGKRAYEFARKGHTDVELKSRLINISEFEVEEFNMPDLTVRIHCSKGTYIRSIARDLGVALGSGGHLIALRRTKVGNINVDDALKMEQFEAFLKQMPKVANA